MKNTTTAFKYSMHAVNIFEKRLRNLAKHLAELEESIVVEDRHMLNAIEKLLGTVAAVAVQNEAETERLMNWNKAAKYVMPFGKYKDRTLDSIAGTDEGLLYLDWLLGEKPGGNVEEMLKVYLSDESIQKDLNDLSGQARKYYE